MNDLKDELKRTQQALERELLKNLKLKMHMQVIVSHPVSLATKIISRSYTRDAITKELQLSTQN